MSSNSANPRRDQSEVSTYTVSDPSSQEELHRQLIQAQMFTTAMGGVLPEQSDPASLRAVLDVGCGPGGWLLDTARAYPTIPHLVGIDISNKMLNYGRAQARNLQLDGRVEFRHMDALRGLDFPDTSFDLVNERFGTSWLRTWDWPQFLQECQRVTRPGGIVRVIEFNLICESSSLALTRLGQLSIDAFYQSGHLFTPESNGFIKELPRLLRQHGLRDVQAQEYELEYRFGTPEGAMFAQDWGHLYRVLVPFLRKWTRMPDTYEEIYQQMLSDMRQPGFRAVSRPLVAWGVRSPTFAPLTMR